MPTQILPQNSKKVNILTAIPYLMPLGPAIILAMVIYGVLAGWSAWIAVPTAIILALLFEASGYYIAHGFIVQVEAGRNWWGMLNLIFLIAFVGCAVGIIVYGKSEIGSDLVTAMLGAFPVLSAMVYITQGMRLGVDESAVVAAVRDDAQWQQQLDLGRQKELAEMEIERLKAEAALELKRLREEAKLAHKYAQRDAQSDAQRDAQSGTDTRTAILGQINAGIGTQAEIARNLGLHRNTVGNHIRDLIVQGVVRKDVHGNVQPIVQPQGSMAVSTNGHGGAK